MRTTPLKPRPRMASDVPEAPAGSTPGAAAPEGVVVVDKPAGWTSHDVVSRMRAIAGTRRVGHAGTLDPMATGVLILGIGRATRLLGHISGAEKDYDATIRLGWSTLSDDADGDRLSPPDGDASSVGPAHELGGGDIAAAVEGLTGEILQRPSAVSAIKIDGRRAHERVRAGERVELAERPVIVSQFVIHAVRPNTELGCTDLSVSVTCSSGTYVRALARDLGQALGVGGHLTELRRTRVGAFGLAEARTLDEYAVKLSVLDLAASARRAFAPLRVTAADANAVRHGRTIQLGLTGTAASPGQAPEKQESQEAYALFAADGEFLALARSTPGGEAQYLAVFSQP